MMKEVNDSTFYNEVSVAETPVVVDFWAPWCGPCKMVSPVLESLEKDYGSKVKFVKINVDESTVISQRYKISSIPTIMIFDKGITTETLVGFRPRQAFEDAIKKYI
ncbi:MAG TPA: thioredoxin [Clostridiaceae bacterium]